MHTFRFRIIATLALVWGVACATLHAEITAMTRERVAEAEQAGTRAAGDDLIIYKDVCRTGLGPGAHTFDVVITTPFGAIADSVFENRKQGTPLDLSHMGVEPPESQFVIVSVDPVSLFGGDPSAAVPAGVQSVVLRRGDKVTEARRADTHEVRFPELDEAHRTYPGGAWYFPLDPFASGLGDLEIVVLLNSSPPGAEAVLKLKKRDLAKMR